MPKSQAAPKRIYLRPGADDTPESFARELVAALQAMRRHAERRPRTGGAGAGDRRHERPW
jgi:hypothetical protein